MSDQRVNDLEVSAGQLVRRAQQGDADAFEQLIERYERVALSVAYSVLQDSTEAGDVVQEGFIRAWQKLPDLLQPEKFGGWICGLVRNFALDIRRRSRTIPLTDALLKSAEESYADQIADPSLRMEQLDEKQRIDAALTSLDDTSRSAVVLRYYEGMSSKEIGDALGLAPAAIDMRLSRARRQLKDLLGSPEKSAKLA